MAKLDHSLIKQTWALLRQGLTHEEIGEELGRSTRSIDDYVNPRWLAERGLGHLSYALKGPEQVPMSRLENEAWGSCRRGDHGWMDDPGFETHAFKTSERLEERDLNNGGTQRSIYLEARCNFCGYSETKRRDSFLVISG